MHRLVSGCPATPVYEGEISCACLGVDAKAFDEDGHPVVGELGELVITSPMPSMPVALWGDEDGERYRASYFDRYPGVWRQGDWIRFTERGSCVLTGRSDATLNRGGVRLGTGEFYSVVEEFPGAGRRARGAPGGRRAAASGSCCCSWSGSPGATVDDELLGRRAAALRQRALAASRARRHHPVSGIPRTLTGKKLEAPVKRILRGEPAERVASRDSLADPAGAGRLRRTGRRARGPRSFRMT